MSKWFTILVWSAAAILTGCTDRPPPNVVILVLDTVRPDYLSVYGHPRPTSPFLESFAARGTKYERAYSTSSWTLPAHASLFTGMLPEVHRATQQNPKIRADLTLLAERLSGAGYQTAGFSNNPWVTAETGLARGFQSFDEKLKRHGKRQKTVDAHPTVRAVESWFTKSYRPESPLFLFVNLMDAHMPYFANWETAQPYFSSEREYTAAVDRFFANGGTQPIMTRHYERESPLSEEEWKAYRSLYEASLRQTDRIAEAIVGAVDARCAPEDTVVFVISDHGENLGDHGHMSHMFNVFDSNLRILCLARGPGFEAGAVERRLVHITDIHPTVLGLAGLEPDGGVVGIDLCESLPSNRLLSASLDHPVISLDFFPAAMRERGDLDPYERDLWAAVSQRYKLIRGSDGTEELYDILADPHELSPLDASSVSPATLKGLSAALDLAKDAARADGAPRAGLPTDPETLEALRALGYVE